MSHPLRKSLEFATHGLMLYLQTSSGEAVGCCQQEALKGDVNQDLKGEESILGPRSHPEGEEGHVRQAEGGDLTPAA